jgi:uncharacterized protein with HEPN domain
MLDAARFALGILRNRTRADLDRDLTLQLALVKLVEIVGEAASKVSPERRGMMPDVRWEDIIGMRHRLIHGYYDINRDILWQTANENLPPLIRRLEQALATHPKE